MSRRGTAGRTRARGVETARFDEDGPVVVQEGGAVTRGDRPDVPPAQPPGLRSSIAAGWAELGGLGRVGLVGVALSALVAVVLGVSLRVIVRTTILDSRIDVLARVVDEFEARGLLGGPDGRPPLDELDAAVERRLLGGDFVRVKVWARDGSILYSDEPDLIGQRFALEPDLLAAFEGRASVDVVDSLGAENVYERGLGTLLEFYLPVGTEGRQASVVFEIYQLAGPLEDTMARVSRSLWLAIGSGLTFLGVFMGSLTISSARELGRRRRQAERLFTSAVMAAEDERRRVVGALHDQVGQPLYRVLYGLADCRTRLQRGQECHDELQRLEDLVREVEAELRGELKRLHVGSVGDAGFRAVIESLAEPWEDGGPTVEVDVQTQVEPHGQAADALFQAAQEAVANARRHAHANRVRVTVRLVANRIELEVTDDGRGPEPTATPGLGLAITRERMAAVGGGAEWGRGRPRGTKLRAWVPVQEES